MNSYRNKLEANHIEYSKISSAPLRDCSY